MVSRQKAAFLCLGPFGKWVSDGWLSAAGRGLPALLGTSGFHELGEAQTEPEPSPNRVDGERGSLA
jgi:hypothetical protein